MCFREESQINGSEKEKKEIVNKRENWCYQVKTAWIEKEGYSGQKKCVHCPDPRYDVQKISAQQIDHLAQELPQTTIHELTSFHYGCRGLLLVSRVFLCSCSSSPSDLPA